MESADHHGGGKLPWMAAVSLHFDKKKKKNAVLIDHCFMQYVFCRKPQNTWEGLGWNCG